MKKITLLIALVFSSSLMFGQIYFEDNFDTATPNTVPTGWMVVDGDGQTPNAAVSEFTSAWIAVDRDGSASGGGNYGGPAGDIAVASTSWYTPAGTSDDWLISPAITPTTDSSITWDAKAQDATYADGYELLISTTGTNVATDFGTVLFTTASEAATWQTRSVDLTAYTGMTIYLAWRNNSTDQFVLLVDNVIVEQNPACFDPSAFVLGPNGITETSADIAWTDANGVGTVFDIEYGAEGFTLGTGTMVNDIATTNYDFTGLMADTAYEFYITANCTGGNGDSSQVGPIGFNTAFDCSSYGLPFSDDFSSQNGFAQCYSFEDTNADATSWGYNNGNDFDGDTVDDPVALIFPPNPTVAKDDWLFLPVFNGVANADYQLTIVYNVFDNPVAGSESFDIVALDSPSSTAAMQTVVGSFNSITQAGAGVPDLLPNAYTSSATYTPVADGDFYFAIHATTPEATSAIFTVFSLGVTETLGVNEFEQNSFTHSYNKASKTLNLESSSLPMTNIEIYSILGQSVVSRPLSNTSESINVSDLNDGVYLAKVYIGENSKTIKFVKN